MEVTQKAFYPTERKLNHFRGITKQGLHEITKNIRRQIADKDVPGIDKVQKFSCRSAISIAV